MKDKIDANEFRDDMENVENKNVTGGNGDSIWKETEIIGDVAEVTAEKENKPKIITYAAKPEKTSTVFLTIEPDDHVSIVNAEQEVLAELKTAMIKKKKLHSSIDEVAFTPTGVPIVVTYYKDQRIIIPISQMALKLSKNPKFTEDTQTRMFKMASNMIGCDIDYIVKGIDVKNGLITASRKAAVLDKIKTYYAELDSNRTSMVARQPRVEGRITAVSPKNLWVEVLGVQTEINASDIDYKYILNLTETYSPGDKLFVNVQEINYPEPFDKCYEDENWLMGIEIKAEHKSFEKNIPKQNFEPLLVGSKCSGTITDISKGIYFILLRSGVNAIAHSYKGNRVPLVGDGVSFVCRDKNEDTCTAIGMITKVISSTYR